MGAICFSLDAILSNIFIYLLFVYGHFACTYCLYTSMQAGSIELEEVSDPVGLELQTVICTRYVPQLEPRPIAVSTCCGKY